MILKQFQFKDSFPSCLKATAMKKGKKTSIAVCFSRLITEQKTKAALATSNKKHQSRMRDSNASFVIRKAIHASIMEGLTI